LSSFKLELQTRTGHLSNSNQTSFQVPFRRKAPIGNEVAKPRRMLSINTLRLSSGFYKVWKKAALGSSFELEASKTSFQGPFRRKAPIGNEVAKSRRMLFINPLRLSNGFLCLEKAAIGSSFELKLVVFRTQTAQQIIRPNQGWENYGRYAVNLRVTA